MVEINCAKIKSGNGYLIPLHNEVLIVADPHVDDASVIKIYQH